MTLKISTFPSNDIYRYRLDVKERRFLRLWKMKREGNVCFVLLFPLAISTLAMNKKSWFGL